jgi:hypothetical protein
MTTDPIKELEDHHELTTDRLLTSMQGEWSGIISFNGLLIGAAAISSAVGDSSLKCVRLVLTSCSLCSTALVMINASAVRATYQQVYDIHPDNPRAIEKGVDDINGRLLQRRRIWMNHRSRAAYVLTLISSLMTMYAICK